MSIKLSGTGSVMVAVSISILTFGLPALSQTGPKTADEFAKEYMKDFNSKNAEALKKLKIPVTGKSEMQEMMDMMSQSEMQQGTQYTEYSLAPAKPDMDKPHAGPDGMMYRPNLKPTNMLTLKSKSQSGSSSVSFPIGIKDGVYYAVGIEPATSAGPTFNFGWQRFTPPKGTWSVLFPNEPEPGRAALEAQAGKEALNDPDVYGVVKNTAAVKTKSHWYMCGETGKRVHAPENSAVYRVACTTYEPDTLKEWYSDAKKNLDEAVTSCVSSSSGKLLSQTEIDFNGSPGREFQIQQKDGALCLGRVFWVKDALYELTVECKKDKPDMDAANKFLTSLELTAKQ